MATVKHIWEHRTQVKEDVLFKKPNVLLKECYEYFKWMDQNPYKRQVNMVVDKTVKLTTTDHPRPYTWQGLCLYLDIHESAFRWFKKNAHGGYTDEFKKVIDHIEKIIYNNKFSGAAVGLFNANIISRDLGLVDKVDNTNKNFTAVDMTKDEVLKVNKQLEDEY